MEELQNWDLYLKTYGEKLIDFLPSVIGAGLMLLIGLWVIKFINRVVRNFFDRKEFDVTLENFIASIINWGLKILLFVLVVTQLGVESASLITVIGAAGLAIGLALQGSLSNLAGGVLILLLKPFRVGDWISAQGVDGTVSEISIFNTKITTFGNQSAIIPNGKLSNETIVNFTVLGERRGNLTFSIGYEDNIKQAKDILLNLLMEQETVLKTEGKAPMVAVAALGESSVDLTVRYWAKSGDFWAIHWLVMEEAKMRLTEAGITIPYPQRTLHHVNMQDMPMKS